MKTLLLTGSEGFIGKNLRSYLQDKYKVLCPRSVELNLIESEAVKQYFERHTIDAIIHCGLSAGARGVADRDTTIEDNLAMVNNLLASKPENVRMVLFGSGSMYGKSRPLHKVKENQLGDFIPEDLYGLSKVQIAQLVKNRNDVVCLNIFGCYGYGELAGRFPSYAIIQNLKHETIVISQNVIFDYLFVEDMQHIVTYFLENKTQDTIINITPTDSISLLEIAQTVNALSDFKSDIVINNPILNNEYTGCNERLLENYKGYHFTSYDNGLQKLMNYIRQ